MFRPADSGTVFFAVTSAAQQCNLPGGGDLVRIVNRGAGDVAVLPQSNTLNHVPVVLPGPAPLAGPAQRAGFLVMANAPAESVRMPPGTVGVSLIGTANASVYLTRGSEA
jgi:hypothetical protein